MPCIKVLLCYIIKRKINKLVFPIFIVFYTKAISLIILSFIIIKITSYRNIFDEIYQTFKFYQIRKFVKNFNIHSEGYKFLKDLLN